MPKRLSASRLNDFIACQHRSALWLADISPPDSEDEGLDLVRRKGLEHEDVVLKRLSLRYGEAAAIPGDGPLETRIQLTRDAMRAGAPLIYQAAFASKGWMGMPDFLVATETATGRHYIPHDAKLAHRPKAEHVIQLGIYAKLLRSEAGYQVGQGVIHTGGGTDPTTFELNQYRYIVDRLASSFEAFASEPAHETKPVRTSACKQCPYLSRCESAWRSADSPTFVAGLSTSQLVKLEKAGVTTMAQLAAADPLAPAAGIGDDPYARLVQQARLQVNARESGQYSVELRPVEASRGFTLMPPPDVGDLFFDMEGDPLYPEGLEYLFGVWGPLGSTREDTFVDLWAHDHAAEKVAFERLIALLISHLSRYPSAHVYHYAAYETSAIKRLAMRYATMEAEVDQLLREQRFVDLYKVARQGLMASTESYSLKDLEKIYWGERTGTVKNASDSIVMYERWRETGDDAILGEIRHYNREDCISTAKLRGWLESLRPKDAVYGLQAVLVDDGGATARSAAREQFERERRQLAARVRDSQFGTEAVRELLAELPWFHQRSLKPVWWSIFDRQTWTDDELVQDFESLGKLRLVAQVPDKQSFVATYEFPPQDTRLREKAQPYIAATLDPAGTIVSLDGESGMIKLRRGQRQGAFPPLCSLTPGRPLPQKKLVAGLLTLLDGLCNSPEQYPALADLLLRRPPRIRGREVGGHVLAPNAHLVQGTVQAVQALDNSALVIQGPPGTGKTYTTARAVVALLQEGQRVGVSSNSHKAINNLLKAIDEYAEEIDFRFSGAKKCTEDEPETHYDSEPGNVANVFQSAEIGAQYQLVGGTAYHFAGEGPFTFDYLFIDEAGQVALGNLVAIAGCTRNIILVGDQMQLPQPVQGVHPGDTGFSCLEYAMAGHATVPPERGILLDVSRRMHPQICGFISETVYDSRLTAHPSTSERQLEIVGGDTPLKPTGLSLVEVPHDGCLQSSLEEAEVIRSLVNQLLQQQRIVRGRSLPITLEDVLIVTPFNLQVALLKRTLPTGARIGTVDKFQGQEAAVVIVSMATSNGEDAPRGTSFLFNQNRFNVATSRAQCLAMLVRGNKLLSIAQPALDDLWRLNMFAGFEQHSAIGAAG